MHLSTNYYVLGSVLGATRDAVLLRYTLCLEEIESNSFEYTKDSNVMGIEIRVVDQLQSTVRSQEVER